MPLPPTKLSQVRDALAAGDVKKALRIAAKMGQLGDQAERITRAWNALTKPDFYRELGFDPDALVADGVVAMRERWGL